MKELKIKLGNGNVLLVHDYDLEDFKQTWYEEINEKDEQDQYYLHANAKGEIYFRKRDKI